MAQESASVTISLQDEISEPLARIQQQFEKLSATMKDIGSESQGGFRALTAEPQQAEEVDRDWEYQGGDEKP